ncbi:MAG: MBL fold metallo-hydrolase [Gammaproteobacteria bacterium]
MPASALNYAFDSPPAAGQTREIYPGLLWVRHSLPMALDHINVWLLSDTEKCVIVDTGINTRSSREAWFNLLDTHAQNKLVERVIATHLHPDHCGLAGWLTKQHDCPLYMTRTEYLLCRTLCLDSSLEVPQEALDFYHAAGLNDAQLKDYCKAFGGFGRAVTPLPPSFRRLQDGDHLELASEPWSVIVGTGHSPEHACLYNERRNVLISGDQILPRISSIVAVWPTEPCANPLADWLSSCRDLRSRIPDDTLILPSHGLPFYGAKARLTQLIDEHESLLEKLHDRCRHPQRVIDVFDILFKSKIDDSNLVMAVGESIAHFNHLLDRGLVVKTRDEAGVDWYEQ